MTIKIEWRPVGSNVESGLVATLVQGRVYAESKKRAAELLADWILNSELLEFTNATDGVEAKLNVIKMEPSNEVVISGHSVQRSFHHQPETP